MISQRAQQRRNIQEAVRRGHLVLPDGYYCLRLPNGHAFAEPLHELAHVRVEILDQGDLIVASRAYALRAVFIPFGVQPEGSTVPEDPEIV